MKKLEINKNDLKNNIEIIKNIDDNIKIIAVVKANGMGLGLVEYSKTLLENGIESLAVANLIKEILKENKDIQIKAHIKIDTGFGRYGFLYNDIENILRVFECDDRVQIIGTYTHFSKPDDKKWTTIQFNRFMNTINKIKEYNYNVGILHCAASTAFLKYPEMRLDAVRVGSAIQGRTLVKQEGLKKIGRFKTNITEIKTLPKGYNISYCNTYKTKKETKIAIIPVRICRWIK